METAGSPISSDDTSATGKHKKRLIRLREAIGSLILWAEQLEHADEAGDTQLLDEKLGKLLDNCLLSIGELYKQIKAYYSVQLTVELTNLVVEKLNTKKKPTLGDALDCTEAVFMKGVNNRVKQWGHYEFGEYIRKFRDKHEDDMTFTCTKFMKGRTAKQIFNREGRLRTTKEFITLLIANFFGDSQSNLDKWLSGSKKNSLPNPIIPHHWEDGVTNLVENQSLILFKYVVRTLLKADSLLEHDLLLVFDHDFRAQYGEQGYDSFVSGINTRIKNKAGKPDPLAPFYLTPDEKITVQKMDDEYDEYLKSELEK